VAVQVAALPSATGLGEQLTVPPPERSATVVIATVSGRNVAVTVQLAMSALVAYGLMAEAAPQPLVVNPPKWNPLLAVAVQTEGVPPTVGEPHDTVPAPTGVATAVTVNSGISVLAKVATRGVGATLLLNTLVNTTFGGVGPQAKPDGAAGRLVCTTVQVLPVVTLFPAIVDTVPVVGVAALIAMLLGVEGKLSAAPLVAVQPTPYEKVPVRTG
jgi:hypothetical protein